MNYQKYLFIYHSNKYYHKIKVLLPLLILYFLCFLKIVICEKNSPSVIFSHQNKNLLTTKNDLLFVSTRDGNLHAYSPSPDTYLHQWSTSLGTELISSNITTQKITNDLLLLPLDDKLFIYENGQFTSLDIFVKDLVEKTPQSFNDFLLIGNKKTTVYIIDKNTGEIIQHSDTESNLINNYQNITKANTITVIRVDYILTCLGKEEKFWNATYSDIIIQKIDNLNDNMAYYLPNKNDIIVKLLDSSELNQKDIVTVHSYDNEYNLPVKIYDKNKKEGKGNELIKQSRRYFNFKDELFDDEDERYKYLQWRENKEKIEVGDIISVFIRDMKIWIDRNLSFFRLVLAFSLALLIKHVVKWLMNRGKKKYQVVIDNKCVALTKKVDYIKLIWEEYKKNLEKKIKNQILNKEKLDIEIENNSSPMENQVDKENEGNAVVVYNQPNNIENNIAEIQKFDGLINDPNKLKKYQKERTDQILVNSYENEDDTVTVEVNRKTKVTYTKNQEIEKIHKKIQELNRSIHSSTKNVRRNSSPSNFHIHQSSNDNQSISSLLNMESLKRKYTEDVSEVYKNGNNIFFDDEENSNINQNNLDIKKSYTDNNDNNIQFGQRSTNDTDTFGNNQNKNNSNTDHIYINKESKISSSTIPLNRLDKDFTNIIKIGQGGFGIVLKAKHKIDEEIYAIKVIKLNHLSEQNVVTEIKTMLKIRYKHIVEYKTCWFEKNLGSASKYFMNSETSSIVTNTLTTNNIINNENSNLQTTGNKGLPQIKEAPSIVFEGDDENDKNNNDISNSNNSGIYSNNDEEYPKIFDDPNSDDEKLTKKKFNHQPIIDFRDDSNIITSRKSMLSRRTLSIVDNLYFFIQMEYCDGLPLDKYINSHIDTKIPRSTIYTFTYQILKSLNKIHSTGIIHRDIKPANIFIVGDDDLKIGDFGLATEMNHSMISNVDIVGTPLYLSPEQIGKKFYNEKVDIFACGLVLYEMCACFETMMERRESINNLRSSRIISDKVKEGYQKESELILWMTEISFDKRPNAMEVLSSKIFKEWKEEIDKL